MQTSYDFAMARAFAGMKADLSNDYVLSRQLTAAVGMGLGVFKVYGSDFQARPAIENQNVITDDAGTYTAGSIVATVNGTVITQTYSVNKDGTLVALAAAILAGVPNVVTSAYVAGSHTITITTRNTPLVVTVDISGITGTMTIASVVNTSLDTATTFVGVTVHDHAREQAAGGVVEYLANETASIMEQGAIYVQCEETVTSDDPVYVRIVADGVKLPGMFGKTSVSGKTVALASCRYDLGGTTTIPAKIVLNRP